MLQIGHRVIGLSPYEYELCYKLLDRVNPIKPNETVLDISANKIEPGILYDRIIGNIAPQDFSIIIKSVKSGGTLALLIRDGVYAEERLEMNKQAEFLGAVQLCSDEEIYRHILLFRKYGHELTEYLNNIDDKDFRKLAFCDKPFINDKYFMKFKDHVIGNTANISEKDNMLNNFISNDAIKKVKLRGIKIPKL